MSSNPISPLLAMNHHALAMYQQLAQAGTASLGQLAGQWPSGQAQLAQLVKSSLTVGQEWKTLQATTFSQMLHSQLAAFRPRQTMAVQDAMELHESLSHDLAVQRKTALKEVGERLDACVNDLRKAESSEDIALVVCGFVEDMGKNLRANTEQTVTLLTSATAAVGILTGRALDQSIAAVHPQ